MASLPTLRLLVRRQVTVNRSLALRLRPQRNQNTGLPLRTFSVLRALRADGHHYYFQRGTTRVNYPSNSEPQEDAPVYNVPGGQRWHQGNQLKQAIQIGTSGNGWFGMYIFWFAFLIGASTATVIFVAMWLAYEGELMPGVSPKTYSERIAEIKAVTSELRKRRRPSDDDSTGAEQDAHHGPEDMKIMMQHLREVQTTLNSANRAAILVNKLVARMLVMGSDVNVINIDHILTKEPIQLRSRTVDPKDATLITVADQKSIKALVLGIDISSWQKDDWWPAEAGGISNWLGNLWRETFVPIIPNPEEVMLIIYSNSAIGAAIPTKTEKGFHIQFFMTRYVPGKDFEPGFPLEQLRNCKFLDRTTVAALTKDIVTDIEN